MSIIKNPHIELKWPKDLVISEECRDLVNRVYIPFKHPDLFFKLLVKDLSKRLTDFDTFTNHPWFESINFIELRQGKLGEKSYEHAFD